MTLTENSESRNKFLDIIVSIENTNKNDRMLKTLLNKNKENLNRRMLSPKFEELLINKDKLLYNIPTKKKHRSLKYMKSFPIDSKQSKFINYKRHLTGIKNMKTDKNVLDENINKYEYKKNDIKSMILTKDEKEEQKEIHIDKDYFLNEKRLKKLDNLKTFLKLIDVHKETQFLYGDDPLKPKLNFIRNKSNFKLFKSSITYDKNKIYFSKKYKLIFDKLKRNRNMKNKKDLFIINNIENGLNSFSSNISPKKKVNKNNFLKKKKILNKSNASESHNLLYLKNRNKSNKSNINIYSNNLKQNKNYVRNNLYSLSNENTKYGQYSFKTNNYQNTNISNYINSSRPQTSFTSKSNKTKFKLSSPNETIDPCETSSLSLVSDIYNLKSFNISKKDSNFSKYLNQKDLNVKFRNESKKILYDILSKTLKKSNKLNNLLKYNDTFKEKEEEKKEERKILNLIKKKKSNLELIVKELNLHYDEQKIDLEELVIKNAFKLRHFLQNDKQFKIMNQVANKVIVEDKILSKEVFIESSLAKKLRKRYKSKSDKEFEFLIEKRKYLKNKMMKYREKTEKEIIGGLMKNEKFDYDDIKSLETMIYKYRTMNHY